MTDLNKKSKKSKRTKLTNQVVNLGLFANLILAAAKLSGGILGHSKALLADGINSFADVVYFILVKFLVKLSAKPADKEHPYGHHQFESIAALLIGAFVITTGISIFWDSVNTAYNIIFSCTEQNRVRLFTLFIGVGTVASKLALMYHAGRIGKKTKNLAVSALAADHRNDIFSSLAAVIGIVFGISGYTWVDPVAGAVVAIIIIKTGVDIIRESSSELMDAVPGKDTEERIKDLLNDFTEIDEIESINCHSFGPYLMLNLTIGIDGDMSVYQGNHISDRVEKHLLSNIEMLRKVHIHYHPYE